MKNEIMKTQLTKAIEKKGINLQNVASKRKHVEQIPLRDIEPGKNSRGALKDFELGKLASSIENRGLLQPIGVHPHPDKPGKYVLTYGFRRFKACQVLGFETISAVVDDKVDTKAGEDLLQNAAENWLRSAPSFAEQGRIFDELFKLGLTQKDIADRTGMSERVINQICASYRKVPAVIRNKITMKKSGKHKEGEIPLNVVANAVTMTRRFNLNKSQTDTLYKHLQATSVTGDDIETMSQVLSRGGTVKSAIDVSQRVRQQAIFVKVDYPKTIRAAKSQGFDSIQAFAVSILKKNKNFHIVEKV
jgi:ParB/RepB/Spo0J family partition protein